MIPKKMDSRHGVRRFHGSSSGWDRVGQFLLFNISNFADKLWARLPAALAVLPAFGGQECECLRANEPDFPYKKERREAQLIPTAGSPTITLLRLNPSYQPYRDENINIKLHKLDPRFTAGIHV